MFNEDFKNNHAPICDFVPGYAYYNDIGYGLAEVLVDIFEWLLDFRRQYTYGPSIPVYCSAGVGIGSFGLPMT